MSHRTCNIVDICKIPRYELLDINFPKIYSHFFILYKLKKNKKACYFAPEYRTYYFFFLFLPLYCFVPLKVFPTASLDYLTKYHSLL